MHIWPHACYYSPPAIPSAASTVAAAAASSTCSPAPAATMVRQRCHLVLHDKPAAGLLASSHPATFLPSQPVSSAVIASVQCRFIPSVPRSANHARHQASGTHACQCLRSDHSSAQVSHCQSSCNTSQARQWRRVPLHAAPMSHDGQSATLSCH